MGSFRSKEDDVSKISTSIFVTNFPDSFSAKDLFHSCKQYGHVVDSFIPTKRTKDGNLTLSLMGRVKEMASLVNLKKALCNEGFDVVKISYLGENFGLVWVELDGVPFKFWSGPTFKRIAAKWGELLDVDDYDESNLHSK
ncbi:nucleotide-binding alpha-beta plait domain-containing protein [Tanacetum coccineum]